MIDAKDCWQQVDMIYLQWCHWGEGGGPPLMTSSKGVTPDLKLIYCGWI